MGKKLVKDSQPHRDLSRRKISNFQNQEQRLPYRLLLLRSPKILYGLNSHRVIIIVVVVVVAGPIIVFLRMKVILSGKCIISLHMRHRRHWRQEHCKLLQITKGASILTKQKAIINGLRVLNKKKQNSLARLMVHLFLNKHTGPRPVIEILPHRSLCFQTPTAIVHLLFSESNSLKPPAATAAIAAVVLQHQTAVPLPQTALVCHQQCAL